jgi:hypothetical protein
VTAEPTPLDSSPPVFGRRPEQPGQAPPTRTFGIEVRYRDRGKIVHEDVMLTAYLTADAGGILRMMQARSDEERAQATAFLLSTCLLDDDGVPSDWRLPDSSEDWLRADGDEAGPEDPEEIPLRGEPTEEEPEGALLYERWDGEPVPWDELAFDEFTEGSSRRRFGLIMASTRYRVELDALTEVSKWLVEQSTKRPTKRPAPSGHGPRSTGRGSGARSR